MGEIVIKSHPAFAIPMGYPAIRLQLFPAKNNKKNTPHFKMTVMFAFQFLNGVLDIVERSSIAILQCRQRQKIPLKSLKCA